jgi:hypothetical protein
MSQFCIYINFNSKPQFDFFPAQATFLKKPTLPINLTEIFLSRWAGADPKTSRCNAFLVTLVEVTLYGPSQFRDTTHSASWRQHVSNCCELTNINRAIK